VGTWVLEERVRGMWKYRRGARCGKTLLIGSYSLAAVHELIEIALFITIDFSQHFTVGSPTK